MATTGSYHLDLDHQKRNVFVTQLHEREDEDEITAFPVVKETGDKLLETGINTLQKTLLLKKEVEVDRVQMELETKRQEFRQRMDACAQKQIEVQKKQQRMKDRVSKFEKFLKENEMKRRRAIQKYQNEVKLKEQKTQEYEQFVEELEELKLRQKYLENKVARYKKYEEYLLKVIDVMPEDYLAAADDKIKGLMMRHRTLKESNLGLVDNLDAMSDEVKRLKTKLDHMKQKYEQDVISFNSQLSSLQQEQEKEQSQAQKLETQFASTHGDLRSRRTELGVIFMAIDNIAEKCHKRLDPPVEKMDLDEKLHKIRDYVNDRSDVAIMAMPRADSPNQIRKPLSADLYTRMRARKKVTING